MRILHTSDWHIGRTLHGLDLSAAHELVDHRLPAPTVGSVAVAASGQPVAIAGEDR